MLEAWWLKQQGSDRKVLEGSWLEKIENPETNTEYYEDYSI